MKSLDQAITVLKQGGIVVYPTDTAYGLAGDATSLSAVKKLYALKGRDFHKPVHVIPPTKSWIEKIVKLNPQAKKLIEQLMPGPLTLVLPLKIPGSSWKLLSAGTQTMGIRRPKHKLALDLAAGLGRPITTTSANISGQPTCYSVHEVKKQFAKAKNKPDFYLDGGKLQKIRPSTVVSVIKGVKILRAGPISETKIKRVISNQ